MKRGQASMEYLMSYGWAILIIIILLAVIIYLRIFDIGNRIPERCEFTVGILCTNAKITDNSVALTLKNGLGAKMALCKIICDDSKVVATIELGGADGQCTDPPIAELDVGKAELPIGPVDGGCRPPNGAIVPVGARYQGKIFLTYYLAGDTGSPRVAEGYLEAVINP